MATSGSVNLSEHELRSLRKWLNQMFPDAPIFIRRPSVEFSRPALVLSESAPRQFDDLGTGFGVRSDSSWQIEYLAEYDSAVPDAGLWDAKRQVEIISSRLLTVRRVPLYLWGWQYPPATLEVLPGEGSLADGELSVIVTAVNAQGEESLGEAVEVTVSAGDAVRIWMLPWPRQSGVAEGFRVYAGASGSELQEAVVPVVNPASPLAIPHVLTDLVGGGTPYASLSGSVFFYRHMCVDSVVTEVLEHPDTDGLFNGYVRVGASVLSQRVFPFSRPLEDVSVSDLEVV